MVNDEVSFWQRIVRTPNCWLWQGAKNSDGYGNLTYRGKPYRAHRLAWILTNGPVPEGMEVCHTCDNPLCANPNHLFVGTHLENMHDSLNKGRTAKTRARGERNGFHKLTWAKVLAIRFVYGLGHYSQQELGQFFNCHQRTVSRVVRNEHWNEEMAA